MGDKNAILDAHLDCLEEVVRRKNGKVLTKLVRRFQLTVMNWISQMCQRKHKKSMNQMGGPGDSR